MFCVRSWLHVVCLYVCLCGCFLRVFFLHTIQLTMNIFKRTIWPIDGALNNTTITPGHSGPGNNDNEWVLHIPQFPRTGASPSDAVYCHTKDTLFSEKVIPLHGVQSEYSKPRCQGFIRMILTRFIPGQTANHMWHWDLPLEQGLCRPNWDVWEA